MSCDCHTFASVHCCLVVTFQERADLLALVCDVYCGFDTFPCGILGQAWCLIVLVPDLCCLSYFHSVCFYDKIKSDVHLNICRRHNKQTTFSGQKT